ncbi:tyrosine-type recombinase/integrase [Arthrobacter bambusae]|uniref:tyrosine-type recombinase/integrase n=1 Tax=Arthrobacter bambusae TaxID=1338426 RepID=UPI0027D76C74|nr:tyrosine-type recombinase/integrase [Arthrobacter bambusae]
MTVMPATARGPLAGKVMERLSAWLAAERYASTMVPQVLGVARGLSAWMEDHDVTLEALTVPVLDAFEAGYGPGVAGHVLVRLRLPALRRFLIEAGHLADAVVVRKRGRPPMGKAAPSISEPALRELDEWAVWQREVRGIGSGCIRHRRAWVAGLVDSLCAPDDCVDWSPCDIAALNAFIVQRSAGFSPASRTLIVDATRSLMRWALATGRVQKDLTGGILRSRSSRATLPRGLSPAQMETLLAACAPATVAGIRDRAVITTLWRLGLRAGEAAGLCLDDIDWGAGRLTVVGKGQRRLTLPLPADVGEALVAWLRVRPTNGIDRALFVRLRQPIRALTSSGISDIVKHRSEEAGLGVVHAHRLRHTAAMNVIASGGTLAEARELLGHRSVASTQVYARTDLGSLRTLTVPFGQVPR